MKKWNFLHFSHFSVETVLFTQVCYLWRTHWTVYYVTLLVETTCGIMSKHGLKWGYRTVMTCGNKLRTKRISVVLKQKLKTLSINYCLLIRSKLVDKSIMTLPVIGLIQLETGFYLTFFICCSYPVETKGDHLWKQKELMLHSLKPLLTS